MNKARCRGITLMEVVVVIVVAGIAIPVLLTMWSTITWQTVRSEGTADAAFYASGLMEEIVSRRFDENAASPWSSTLGVNTGESSANSSTFDDVDDFNSTTDTNVTSPAPGYARSALIRYVVPNATGGWDSCPAGTCNDVAACPSCCTTCAQCCYKRITVNVRRTDNIPTNISLATIVSGY